MQEKEQDKSKKSLTGQPVSQGKTAEYARTAGEKIHNEITFRGVDFFANTAFAVSFAVLTNRTKLGQNWFAKPVTNGFKFILKPMVKDAKTLEEWAGHGTTFTSIMAGGTAIIPPMIYLDKNRMEIVENLDRRIYGDAELDTNPRFAARYEALASRPEKRFGIGMLARFGVLVPMIYCHMKYNDQMNKIMYQPIGSMSKGFCNVVGIKPGPFMKERFHGPQDDTTWQFMHTTLGMDVGLTFIYSFAHEWAYKSLTNLFHGHSREQAANVNAPLSANENNVPQTEVSAANLQLRDVLNAPKHEVAYG